MLLGNGLGDQRDEDHRDADPRKHQHREEEYFAGGARIVPDRTPYVVDGFGEVSNCTHSLGFEAQHKSRFGRRLQVRRWPMAVFVAPLFDFDLSFPSTRRQRALGPSVVFVSMLGSTVVIKAAKKGYKRYGIPGAVVAGGGMVLGIRFIKRRLSRTDTDSETDTATDSPTTDAGSTPDAESSGN